MDGVDDTLETRVTCVTVPNVVIPGLNRTSILTEFRRKILSTRVPLFRVVGTDTDRSVTYDFY